MRMVAFPFHDWRKGQREGFRTRDLHVLEWLGRDPRVATLLVVDRPVSLAERIGRRVLWHVEGDGVDEMAIGGHRARLTRVGERTLVLNQSAPAVWGPISKRRGWWFDAFADAAAIESVAWAVRQVGGVDSCMAWHPAADPVIEHLAQPFVFDSLDNWLIHPAFESWRNRSSSAYASLLPRARTVFVSAPASKAVLEPWRSDIRVLPNGVDADTFAVPQPRPPDLPDGPIVGYVGKLARRIDADLVAATAAARPEFEFVFVGPALEPRAIAPMRKLANVHLLGDRGYESVPAYMQHFDVCWIPHSVGVGETGGDPIKLYEYWAAGKPVVSTRIDGMEAWSDRAALVDGPEEAVKAIDGLMDGSRVLPEPSVPSDRTWQAISERLLAPLLGGEQG